MGKTLLYLLFILELNIIFKSVSSFNCDQVENTKSNLSIPWDLTWPEFKKCLVFFGKETLNISISNNIWNLIKEFHNGIDNIPTDLYQSMGRILTGIPIEDLRNITFDQINIIEAFGVYRGFSTEQMDVIAEKVRKNWTNKTPQQYSHYDLRALNQILCHFNVSEIRKIHADAYKEAAEVIGKLRNCPHTILRTFGELAVQPNAFGNPKSWSKLDFDKIGIIVIGLTPNDYSAIPAEYSKSNKYNTTNGN